MTHSLHRIGTEDSLSRDFVVAALPAMGINNAGHEPKLKTFLQLALKHNPKNYGVGSYGNEYSHDGTQVIEHAGGMAHAVFTSVEDVKAFLTDLKAADLGMSVIVSGILDVVNKAVTEVSLKRHTVNVSLGVWGNTKRLPPVEIREITTMCGHGMIATNLVQKLVDDVRSGVTTAEAAGRLLAAPCCCGIFNPARAAELIAAAAKK